MKVFACRRQGGYCGGLIIVAARTKEEAFLTAASDKEVSWLFNWCDDEGSWCEPDGNINHVRSDTYPLSMWGEVEHLFTDLEKPQVILEGSYTE